MRSRSVREVKPLEENESFADKLAAGILISVGCLVLCVVYLIWLHMG